MNPSAPSSAYLDELNDVQRAAVTTTQGPVLVVAGPGSGKTRVLTYRIAYILEQGVAPWKVLALTFTNKAAREMKERIEKVVGPKAEQVWAGTFHSLFARILRVEAQHIGYPSNFTIYDSDDTKSLIGTIIKEMNLDKTVYGANAVRQRIASAKSNLITPALYAKNEELMLQDKMAKMPLLHKIYEAYSTRCRKAGAMDFDDLLYRLYELLQTQPDVLQKYREKFQYVMVDEFQDTNHLQYAIIRRLVNYPDSPRNICVVGDDAQSIYAFRGATIQNILDYENDFRDYGIQTFKLEQNYRSTEPIVHAANEVITYNRRQIPKRIWSDKGQGQKIMLIKAVSDTEEGKRVADTILEQKHRYHLRNSEIAVLYRTNAQSRIFEEYLRKANIAYRVYGGLSFYQRKEVKDLVAYLRIVVNPNDEEALRRVINFPKRGIGDSSVEAVTNLSNQGNMSLWDALKHCQAAARTRKSMDEFVSVIEQSRKKLDKANAYEVATQVAKQSGLLDFYRQDNSIEGMGRQENLESMLNGIQAFVEDDTILTDDKGLAAYLQNIALLTDFDDNSAEGKDEFVTLMSVHSAKGLEYKSVFVTGLEEKLFPSFMSMDSPDGLDEERRLFYVAITRAEQFLTLSFATTRYRFGKMTFGEASRFLGEIPPTLFDTVSPFSRMTGNAAVGGGPALQPVGAKVQGYFAKSRASSAPEIDPKDFVASPAEAIQPGVEVLHLKFGKGKVIGIEGGIAHIRFPDDETPDKKIMLKFAKLQVIN